MERTAVGKSAGRYILLASAIAVQALASSAFAGKDSGGGDLCEDRIKIIRDDLNAWIVNGGPSGLKLPAGMNLERYSEAMRKQIKRAKIQCVGKGDKGYPVTVDGVPKACRFERERSKSLISCDTEKFQATSESQQYALVHHEFAGLAGLEVPNGSDSDYTISNQISGFLVSEVVKKLAVKPRSSFVSKFYFAGEVAFTLGGLGKPGTRPVSLELAIESGSSVKELSWEVLLFSKSIQPKLYFGEGVGFTFSPAHWDKDKGHLTSDLTIWETQESGGRYRGEVNLDCSFDKTSNLQCVLYNNTQQAWVADLRMESTPTPVEPLPEASKPLNNFTYFGMGEFTSVGDVSQPKAKRIFFTVLENWRTFREEILGLFFPANERLVSVSFGFADSPSSGGNPSWDAARFEPLRDGLRASGSGPVGGSSMSMNCVDFKFRAPEKGYDFTCTYTNSVLTRPVTLKMKSN